MKSKTLISALILSVAAVGAAQAGTPRGDSDNTPFQGVYGQVENGASRAQVVAELQQAQVAGLTGNSELNNVPFTAQADSGMITADVDRGNTVTQIAFGDTDNQPFEGA